MTTISVDFGHLVITPEKIRRKLDAGRDVVILEVWRDGPTTYAHLPGAHTVTLAADLVGPRHAGSGNFPLPTQDQIQGLVRRLGINADSIVVVYTREHPALAARAWWTLKWAGVPDVRVLEGGTSGWTAAGGELVADPPAERVGTFVVTTGSLPTLDTEQAAALARSGTLLDARSPEAYTGQTGGGHIPGAHSLPSSELLGADGRLAGDEELRRRYRAAGVEDAGAVGAYCGGGTSATLTVLGLAKLGITAALYPGSFSAYNAEPSRPVVTGDQAG